MFLKYQTLKEAQKAREEQQKLLPDNYIICPPIAVWDGTYAIPKVIAFKTKGEPVNDIEPEVSEDEGA